MYHLLYRGLFWPAYEALVKGRRTSRRLRCLESGQWWDPARLELFQAGERKKLLEYHHQHSPWFAEACDRVGIQRSELSEEAAFGSLPIIAKEDVRQNLERMKTDTAQGRVFRKATGGSTGQPLHFVHDEVSYEWRVAAAFRAYSWAQCEDGQKTIYIWGGPMGDPQTAGGSKERLHHFLQRRKVFNSYHFDEERMRRCYEFTRKYRPSGIVGYTSALCSLANFINREKLRPLSVHGIVTAAEGVDDSQRELLESVFGGKVFATYGGREFMSIGAECEKHEGLHLQSENLIVEIIKDGKPAKPGEVGEIVVTDLHNYAMPFIRYRIGDMGAMSEKPCSCGRGLPLMKSVIGRELDILHTADGREVPGEFFPHLMKEYEAVETFQVVQKSSKLIELRLQAGGLGTEAESAMKGEIRKVFGDSTEVKLCYMDEIPVTPSGKFRVTISEIGGEERL